MSADFSEQIHPPFCLRGVDDRQRCSVFVDDWTYSQVEELDDYLEEKRFWYVSSEQDSIPRLMTADDIFNIVLDGRSAKKKQHESALEKKLEQYNKLKEELGL